MSPNLCPIPLVSTLYVLTLFYIIGRRASYVIEPLQILLLRLPQYIFHLSVQLGVRYTQSDVDKLVKVFFDCTFASPLIVNLGT